MFRLALVQMEVVGGDIEQNLGEAERRIAEAASEDAQCVVLPEAMDAGWTHPAARDLATVVPGGATFERLAQAARSHGIYVCSGLTERDGDRVYNAAVIIGPDGGLLLKHRKLNELEIGHPYYDQGDRLGVCRTPLGTFGLMICADGFAKDRVISRTLGYMGADVILSPSAWAVAADHDNEIQPYGGLWTDVYTPVAREFALWIAAVSNVGWLADGPWKGRKCIGCSKVVDPSGREVLNGPYGVDAATVLYVEIEPKARPAHRDGMGEPERAHGVTSRKESR